MARFETDVGLDDFMESLSSVELEMFAPEALEKAAPLVQNRMEQLASSHSRTGRMKNSIRSKKPTHRKDRYTLFVGPQGKDRKGVRNMEKMAFLEYGVKAHNQPATPIITPTVMQTRDAVCESMQNTFDEYLTKKNL